MLQRCSRLSTKQQVTKRTCDVTLSRMRNRRTIQDVRRPKVQLPHFLGSSQESRASGRQNPLLADDWESSRVRAANLLQRESLPQERSITMSHIPKTKSQRYPTVLFTCIMLLLSVFVFARPALAATASANTVTLSIEGTYTAEDKKVLIDYINGIRREACNEGVPDPRDPDRVLTPSDYVPIRWSTDLEEIARIRAAESAILFEHTRPNGEICFTVRSSNNISSGSEIIAGTSDIIFGIDLFCSEKNDWVNQTPGAVTGHYTTLIDPSVSHIGLAGFSIPKVGSATAGEALRASSSSLSEAKITESGATRVPIEFANTAERPVTLTISGPTEILRGRSANFSVIGTTPVGGAKITGALTERVSWASSNSSVASINSSGVVTSSASGRVTITAKVGNNTLSSTLLVTPFSDVHSSTPHIDDILWLGNSGVSEGYHDGTFRPMNSVYRQDMAAFLYRLAGSPAYEPTAADKSRFSDIDESTPHYREILWLGSTGIAEGYVDGTFRGMTPVYRQDMAAFLRRLAVYMEDQSAEEWTPSAADWSAFPDVSSRTPHAEDILWLSETGISEGYPDRTFRGMTPVYRQDMAAFLQRLFVHLK